MRTPKKLLAAAATLLFLGSSGVLIPLAEASRGGRSPSGKATASRGARSAPAPTATAHRSTASGAPTRAQGKATYGHYPRGAHGYYPGHDYAGWWGPYHGYWGWPWAWWGWGYAGWPAYYPGAYPVLVGGEARNGPGVVETDIRPKKAEVYLDGQWVGEARDFNGTWDQLYLKPGRRTIEFRADGYQSLRLILDVSSGMHYRVAERLQKGEGLDPRSSTRPPPEAAASVRGASVIYAAESDRSVPPAGLRQGLLKLIVHPRDAAVYLDGEFLAGADELARLHGALPVAVGEHRIEIVRPGYRNRTLAVTIGDGEPTQIEVDLERGAQEPAP